MADADFPSGPWTGYYQYPDGRRGGMDLNLRFEGSRLTGQGQDELGRFRVEGSYDAANHEALWSKSYPSGHAVEYRGFREGPVKGIWGTWQITGDWSGGFHIWPLEDGQATENRRYTAEEIRRTRVAPTPLPVREITVKSDPA